MSEQHGTVIASVCYEQPGDIAPGDYKHRRIGKLIYYRSHDCQLRLDLIPAKAWSEGIDLFIGNFQPSEKVPEPPFVDGDLMAVTEDRGDPVRVGHIWTVQNPDSRKIGDYAADATQYQLKLIGLPVREWARVRFTDKKSIYLKVRLA